METPFEKYQAYISSQGRQIKAAGEEPGVSEPAITISRQTGAGAITFGVSLARYLNENSGDQEKPWTVFDKNLIRHVLEDHGLPAYLERHMPEDSPSHVKDAVGDMLGLHPPNWELVKRTGETISRLARVGRCIVVGRGANVITRDLLNTLHLRLVAPLERRVDHCAEYYGISTAEALDRIKKQDRARRRYVLAYHDEEIDDPTNYHFVINVDSFTPQALTEFVAGVVANWEKATPKDRAG
jgi:cytidylate kinase